VIPVESDDQSEDGPSPQPAQPVGRSGHDVVTSDMALRTIFVRLPNATETLRLRYRETERDAIREIGLICAACESAAHEDLTDDVRDLVAHQSVTVGGHHLGVRQLCRVFVRLVDWWGLEDDAGVMIPIAEDSLGAMPAKLLADLIMRILLDRGPELEATG
jgi:hypothetical protein